MRSLGRKLVHAWGINARGKRKLIHFRVFPRGVGINELLPNVVFTEPGLEYKSENQRDNHGHQRCRKNGPSIHSSYGAGRMKKPA